ncbi:hypothetical protein CDAR_568881 [Caerostris darwini]|uniref:Uncharacterized protein n=1 Tax=Caerostris darwini TaxID=1538125 RepID=A0AAV4MH50_9ARAC|nr:hypothetical protein CDAR_568881 [Caerostris darwini]
MKIRNNFQPFSQTVEKFVFNLRIKQVVVQDCFWNNKRSGGPVGRGVSQNNGTWAADLKEKSQTNRKNTMKSIWTHPSNRDRRRAAS